MELRLQPTPVIDIKPSSVGIVSRKEFFVRKKFEEINQYFFPGHLIRNWKPKADLIYPSVSNEKEIQYECDFNRDVQNCFVEDYAEEVFLRSPPPCFVVFGKFREYVNKLGRQIAEEYDSVLIQVDDVINQVIETESETATILEKLLRLGASLTLNFILALISYLAHTAESRHRGYVLSGLPLIPLGHDLSPEQQFNYLFTWENKPTVFVYVLFEDEDLIKTRSCLRYEIKNCSKYCNCSCICQHFDRVKEDEDSETNNLVPSGESGDVVHPSEPDIDISPSRPWVKLPKDEESQIYTELELFDKIIKPVIELVISRIDPQYFITVDSRIKNEFELVKARLSLLQIWKAPLPIPFIPLPEKSKPNENNLDLPAEDETILDNYEEKDPDDEEDEEIKNIVQQPPESAFLSLFQKKVISSKFRWELSHYNYICPVSLRAGEVVLGKAEYSVIFMKYIYFLHDRECMIKFLKNPRAYVLPVRPKPPSRFMIVGYPFCKKTELAKLLAEEFSVPLINCRTILKTDLDRKKNIYKEFCKKKAEYREWTRLTTLAWRDWRLEEEQRVFLIDAWIEFIQSLLTKRIEQFYSEKNGDPNTGEANVGARKDEFLKTNLNEILTVKGAQIESVPPPERENADDSSVSVKIIKALKHEDFNLNKKSPEAEANSFFSSLWNSFSYENPEFDPNLLSNLGKTFDKDAEKNGSTISLTNASSESKLSLNWCHFLPPQSVSSFRLRKKPYTPKQQKKNFRILLEAASKAYWKPSDLKLEFAQWRLPCFMDIPLCEIYLDNPILLYKFVPEWLKQRPPIPEVVDSNHPAIVEAGQRAFNFADVVNVQHTIEEVGILIKHAIEKVEKDGMRITGEVLSTGGWVLDDMVLDLPVWCMLAKENVFPTHIYILQDTQPELRRIINHWFDLYQDQLTLDSSSITLKTRSFPYTSDKEMLYNYSSDESSVKNKTDDSSSSDENNLPKKYPNIVNMLLEFSNLIAKADEEVDEVYEVLLNGVQKSCDNCVRALAVDPFCHHMLLDILQTSCDHFDELVNDESILASLSFSSILGPYNSPSKPTNIHVPDYPVGVELQKFTNKILDIFRKRGKINEEDIEETDRYADGVLFFLLLLTLPQKIYDLKELVNGFKKNVKVKEIDMFGNDISKIFKDEIRDIYLPFLKKPRELEKFELEEIDKALEFEKIINNMKNRDSEGAEEFENEIDIKDYDDIRIYGESGPFCIVNLERDILLKGNPEHVLRYYGKLYFFWDEASKLKFIQDPEKYAPYYSPIRSLPPLRIFVIGSVGCGTTGIAKAISEQCSIHYVDNLKFLGKNLIPYVVPRPQKLKSLSKPLLVSNMHNKEAKIAMEEFLKAPYTKRKEWMENPPIYPFIDIRKMKYDIEQLKVLPVQMTDVSLVYRNIPTDSDDQDLNESNSKNSFTSMKEIEGVIKNYIDNCTSLTDYCVDKSLKILWNRRPFTTEGFVIKNFPLRASDVSFMMKNNWIPDAIIQVNKTEEEATEHLIQPMMELWETKLKQEEIDEKLIEDIVKNIQEIQMTIRKQELRIEKQTLSAQVSLLRLVQESQVSSPSSNSINFGIGEVFNPENLLKRNQINSNEKLETSEAVGTNVYEEINEILKNEFPTLIFNPKFETYEEGKARITNEILEHFRKDEEEINKIKLQLENVPVPWIQIQNNSSSELYIKLNFLKKRIDQRGEFAFEMSLEIADRLLKQGYYFLSKFGRLCPVQAYRGKNPINMFRPLKSRGKIFPIAYRNYIYFIGGENEKVKFIEDPLRYTFHEPHHPNIPLRIAVIGPPKSGKTSLCKRLGLMFDLKVITMGSAIRFVLENMPDSILYSSINNYLKRGCFLPLSLKVEALLVSLNDVSCVTQGFVFDGVPYDAAMAQSLAEKKKLPFVIISLVGGSTFAKDNRANLDLTEFRLPYKQRVNLDSRYKEWNETYSRFTQWIQGTYNNLYEIKAELNITNVFYSAYDIIRKSYFGILNYVEYCITDKVLPLQYLCVTHQEFESRKSKLSYNCPVCWIIKQRLVFPSDTTAKISGLFQYVNHFYWVCSDHAQKFLKNPKKYMEPDFPKWPDLFPETISIEKYDSMDPKPEIHGLGRCPVTKIDFPSSLEWEGSWDFAAYYSNEIFLCKNKDMLERFLAQPWRYSKADTKFEYNRNNKSHAVLHLGPPTVTTLPPIGFLEQTVANIIHSCLQVLGTVRPIYPNMSAACTACNFAALFFKVNNPKKKPTFLDNELFEFMYYSCKAYRFCISFSRKSKEEGQGDFEIDSIDSDSTESITETVASSAKISTGTADSYKVDIDNQADKKFWSAKCVNENMTQYRLTANDELEEIQLLPKVQIVIHYSNSRTMPLPPVLRCLTFLYSVKPQLKLPEEFNVHSLYQPLLDPHSWPCKSLIYNPEKAFSWTIYKESSLNKKESSASDNFVGSRNLSLNSGVPLETTPVEVNVEYMLERFIPRFKLLDVKKDIQPPKPPEDFEQQPLVYEPHRDYAYTLLLSYFFKNSHILKSFEWKESKSFFDYTTIFNKNLGLCNIRSQFLLKPKRTGSFKSRKSIQSFQDTLETVTTFLYKIEVPGTPTTEDSRRSSVINFIQTLILSKIDELFAKISSSEMSYDAYETSVLSIDSSTIERPEVVVREILPFPPLIWEIISRPYYCLQSIPSIFEFPVLENIAHERHVSLLDGVIGSNQKFRFVRYPSWVQDKSDTNQESMSSKQQLTSKCPRSKGPSFEDIYFMYDMFGLEWTAFMTYPFSWSFNTDLKENFQKSAEQN